MERSPRPSIRPSLGGHAKGKGIYSSKRIFLPVLEKFDGFSQTRDEVGCRFEARGEEFFY